MTKLELMDWKAVEKTTEEALRNAMISIKINDLILFEARKEILKLNGKTSDQEKEADAAQQKKLAESTTAEAAKK